MKTTFVVLMTCLLSWFAFQAAHAQEGKIYLPVMETADLVYSPNCADVDNDGEPENLYAPSAESFASGTPFKDIQAKYRMFSEDFKVNYRFFGGKIDGVAKRARVCLPIHNDTIWAQPGDKQVQFLPYMKFSDGVPGWESNLLGHQVQTSALMTNTYMIVGFDPMVALTTWQGAEVIGTLGANGQEFASILELVPGAGAVAIGASVFLGIDALYNAINNGTVVEKIDLPVMVLPDGSSITNFANEQPFVYLRCYDDVVAQAKIRLPGEKLRMHLFSAEGVQGCLVTLHSQGGGVGDVSHAWNIVEAVAVELAAKRKSDDLDAKRLIEGWEEYIERKAKPQEVPPPVQDQSWQCSDLLFDPWIRAMAVNMTAAHMNTLRARTRIESYPELTLIQSYADQVIQNLTSLVFVSRYDDPKPRNHSGIYKGHLTTEPTGTRVANEFWTVEGDCYWNRTNAEWNWVLSLQVGRLENGVTSTFPRNDLVPARKYPY